MLHFKYLVLQIGFADFVGKNVTFNQTRLISIESQPKKIVVVVVVVIGVVVVHVVVVVIPVVDPRNISLKFG